MIYYICYAIFVVSNIVFPSFNYCRNFNFTIPYMDIYDEKQSGSKEIRRPPKNSLWAQTGEDDMKYVEDNTHEQNKKKEIADLYRYNSFLEERRSSMIIPPRQNSALGGDTTLVSRPASAAGGAGGLKFNVYVKTLLINHICKIKQMEAFLNLNFIY